MTASGLRAACRLVFATTGSLRAVELLLLLFEADLLLLLLVSNVELVLGIHLVRGVVGHHKALLLELL